MDYVWIIIFGVIAAGLVFYLRSVNPETAEQSGTVNFNKAVGSGIIGLGILLLVMPWAASATAAFDFVSSSDFSVLTGADYVLGIVALLAGLALFLHKEEAGES